jgi:hypothetical protein
MTVQLPKIGLNRQAQGEQDDLDGASFNLEVNDWDSQADLVKKRDDGALV